MFWRTTERKKKCVISKTVVGKNMRKKETLIDYKKDKKGRSFGGPVAKIPCSQMQGPFDAWSGNWIPHARSCMPQLRPSAAK